MVHQRQFVWECNTITCTWITLFSSDLMGNIQAEKINSSVLILCSICFIFWWYLLGTRSQDLFLGRICLNKVDSLLWMKHFKIVCRCLKKLLERSHTKTKITCQSSEKGVVLGTGQFSLLPNRPPKNSARGKSAPKLKKFTFITLNLYHTADSKADRYLV